MSLTPDPSHPALSQSPALLCSIPAIYTTSGLQSVAYQGRLHKEVCFSENPGKGKSCVVKEMEIRGTPSPLTPGKQCGSGQRRAFTCLVSLVGF